MKCFSKTLQNLPYFWNTKISIFFFVCFSFCSVDFSPLKIMQYAMKKTRQFLKCFGTFQKAYMYIEFVKSEQDDAKKAADGELVLAIDKYWRAIKVVTQSAH